MFLEQVAAGIFVNEVVGTRVGNEETELWWRRSLRSDVDTTLTPVNNLVGSPRAVLAGPTSAALIWSSAL